MNKKQALAIIRAHVAEGISLFDEAFEYLEKEINNEEVLSCSEVVERLAKCVQLKPGCFSSSIYTSPVSAEFNRELATEILHSWREHIKKELGSITNVHKH